MTDSQVNKRIIVSGRVQGVGYRFFVLESAERLGVTGWVRNLPDGRVEAEVQGTSDAIENLLSDLRTGPRLSHVTSVDVQELSGNSSHTGFHVR